MKFVIRSKTLNFTVDLNDPTSVHFISLSESMRKQIQAILDAAFPDTTVTVKILGFRPGSVLTDYEARFSNKSVPSNEEVRSALINGSSNVTGFDIEASSITFQDTIAGSTTTTAPVTTMAAASTTAAAPVTSMAAANATTLAANATTAPRNFKMEEMTTQTSLVVKKNANYATILLEMWIKQSCAHGVKAGNMQSVKEWMKKNMSTYKNRWITVNGFVMHVMTR
ncbi:uncharacterized protein KZ484_016793 [Pholidichthys leucotaenia]